MTATLGDIWHMYRVSLHRFIQQRVGEASVADDILQEVFLRALTRIETLHDPQKLRSWLYQITRHAIIDYYRTQRTWDDLPDELMAPTADDAAHARQELAHCLLPLLYSLPDIYREALMQSEIEEIPLKHVAAEQGLSLSGAKSRVQRGRALLRAALTRCCQVAFDHRGTVVEYMPVGTCGVPGCAPGDITPPDVTMLRLGYTGAALCCG
jgi:RNA polymerase sigma-70 factor (ECF subfamily)